MFFSWKLKPTRLISFEKCRESKFTFTTKWSDPLPKFHIPFLAEAYKHQLAWNPARAVGDLFLVQTTSPSHKGHSAYLTQDSQLYNLKCMKDVWFLRYTNFFRYKLLEHQACLWRLLWVLEGWWLSLETAALWLSVISNSSSVKTTNNRLA